MRLRIAIVPSVTVARGDVIVVECPGPVAGADRRTLEAQLATLWPRNRILILTDGAQLKIGLATRRRGGRRYAHPGR